MGYGLFENKQILQDMYRLGPKGLLFRDYQLNDRGLVECKVGVIRPQPLLDLGTGLGQRPIVC